MDQPTTPSSMNADAVVGAGVIGSVVALELARGGRSVLVLDKAAGRVRPVNDAGSRTFLG